MTQTEAAPIVGVLAVHGAVAEHINALESIGRVASRVSAPADLARVAALIVPGGESTTMRLTAGDALIDAARRAIKGGLPTMGTCAGLIALADEIANGDEPIFGGLDVTVERNGYGRQVASFEGAIRYEEDLRGDPDALGVFIRAPRIIRVGEAVRVVARHNGEPVAVRSGEIIATAYHPELTDDTRLHAWLGDRAQAYHQHNTQKHIGEGLGGGTQ